MVNKCPEGQIPLWSKIAENLEKVAPDVKKYTLTHMKKALEQTFGDPKGCIPKPIGRGGGERFKNLSENVYRKAEKDTGKKWKDLY